MASKNYPNGRDHELVIQELKGELLIYDLNINKAYCLNSTSAMIWNLCDGQSSVSEMTRKLSKKLKQPVTDDLVWLALDQFKTDNLLSDNNEIEIKFNGLSRREVIRKVGFATLVTLPMIGSLMAPTAAMAASTGLLAAGAPCTLRQQCASNSCLGTCFAGGRDYGPCSGPSRTPCRGSGTCNPVLPGRCSGEDNISCSSDAGCISDCIFIGFCDSGGTPCDPQASSSCSVDGICSTTTCR